MEEDATPSPNSLALFDPPLDKSLDDGLRSMKLCRMRGEQIKVVTNDLNGNTVALHVGNGNRGLTCLSTTLYLPEHLEILRTYLSS